MDLERFMSYLDAIDSLLKALDREEQTAIDIDPGLIDLGLVAVMRSVAKTAADQGQQDSADFLSDIAARLEEQLVRSASQA